MVITQYAAPTIEPVTLAELKAHLKCDSGTLANNTTLFSCISSGSHGVVTDYTLIGVAVEVLGKNAIVYLQPVNNGTAATVDCKLQESDDNTIWTDWSGGAFTQVTEANDTIVQEKQYTGVKRYIRTAAKTRVQACEFGTSVLVVDATATDDALLASILTAAREHVEDICRRYFLTQTRDYSLQAWPNSDRIKLPGGNLQTVSHVKWKDTAGIDTTLTLTTDYLVELNGDQCGFIVLPYGCSWPSGSLYPSNPITIRYVCGWTTSALVPYTIKAAILMICGDLYANRESQMVNNFSYHQNVTVKNLLASAKLWDSF